MNKSLVARHFLLSTLFFLIAACAKISAPSGGLRDRTPPVVLKSVPEYGARNFKGKSVTVTFDEFVALDNITEKFMVSPPMKKKPRVFLKGKSVVTEFEEKLKDSTTYTFYFQDAIKDLNEGNVLENYQFVLSTWSVLDSLSVTGNVSNAFNLEVPEKTLVLLYRELEDTAVIKHLPAYISRVDPTGYFRINNVSAGTYRLYALKDDDNSKNYNLPSEEFAFLDSAITVTPEKSYILPVKDTLKVILPSRKASEREKNGEMSTLDSMRKGLGRYQDTIVVKGEYPLMLFAALKKSRYLTSSGRPAKYQLFYTLSLPPDIMPFRFRIPDTDEKSYFLERNLTKDTIKVWLTDSTLYSKSQISTIINFPFTDSLGAVIYREDTITMRFATPRIPRNSRVKKTPYVIETNINNAALKPGQPITFRSKTPFREADTSRIKLYQIADSSKIRLSYTLIKDSLSSGSYDMNAKLIQGKKYLLIADTASFGDIYNESIDSTGYKFSVREPESYSKLTLNIRNYQGDRIIQLLNNTEKLVRETIMKADGKLVLPMLETGVYRVKVIYDLNGNGKWDTGDFDEGKEPEPVSYYPREIDLQKANWEIEQDWDIGTMYLKAQKLKEKRKPKR